MNIEEFIKELKAQNIEINEYQLNQFDKYYNLLVEWNKKMNLTAITEKEDVYLKHFFDSISSSFHFDFTQIESVCDVGAGAGFPSIPLKICYPHLKITIVDSLNKRITFLENLAKELKLGNVNFVHARAEDFGQNKAHRETYDLVTARAVARTNVLSEYCLPLCKIKGHFIAMKGALASEELQEANKAITTLGGELKEELTFNLPHENSERSIIIIEKTKKTPKKYPRKPGTPQKLPL
ncbi:MAG TPA: 16S rRNA (guanine(527)-N(7))-methyltransferase RsmG [Pseudogracilibacillus sp.]|nr:16S rRNA (guanine(527)-N(7))-methyltransferase RsmG [Pseudogracilibacillus sp.]